MLFIHLQRPNNDSECLDLQNEHDQSNTKLLVRVSERLQGSVSVGMFGYTNIQTFIHDPKCADIHSGWQQWVEQEQGDFQSTCLPLSSSLSTSELRASRSVVAQMATVVFSCASNKSCIEMYRPPTLMLNRENVCVCLSQGRVANINQSWRQYCHQTLVTSFWSRICAVTLQHETESCRGTHVDGTTLCYTERLM